MRTKQGSYPAHASAQAARLKAGRPSSLVDTRVIYCGDCLEHLRKHPDALGDQRTGIAEGGCPGFLLGVTHCYYMG